MSGTGSGGGGRVPTLAIETSNTMPAPPDAVAQAEADSIGRLAAAGGPKRCPTCDTHYPGDFLVCPRDATALVLDENAQKDPLVGAVLGDAYQVRGVIGEGGMGRVYEARHVRLTDRRLAIKILHPEYARDPDVVQRFQREAQSASMIGHPNVIDVYDVHKTPDGRPYLVGEFLEGEELGAHLKRVGKLDVPTAVAVTRQIASALAAAHERGIVHRDMKPENVFIVVRGGVPHVKVLDFGISKIGADDGGGGARANLTRTGMIMGTPSYMAPEQARGEKVDQRADVYATGGVLYSLVTGKKPFDDDDPATTITQLLTAEPPRPRSLEPSIPEALELVIQRAMAKDPRDRFQTMEDFDAALVPFDSGAVFVPAVPPSALPKSNGTLMSRTAMARGPRNDPSARTVAGAAPSATLDARAAKLARPTIVLSGLGVLAWFVAGFVDALAGTIRWFRPGEITFTEALLLAVGSLFLAIAPVVLFTLHVKRVVWPNSVKSMELAADVRRTAAVALLTYGAGSIVVRLLDSVILRSSADLSSGLWDAALFAASLVAALVAGGVGPIARSMRRKANG